MIDANRKKVVDILNKSVKYVIPENQRNFDWKKDQAEEFWEDIQIGGTFLGTVVFDISGENSDKEIVIVDGQQRLTTIFILLAACRTRAKKNKSHDQVAAIQGKLSFKDDATGESISGKLDTSPSIREVFNDTIINSKWDGENFNFKGKRRQVNRIRPIYEHFSKKIDGYNAKQIARVLNNLYDCSLVQIDITDTQEAFDIFERTNARGMELNAADLLKNYLFARDASGSLDEEWEKIVEYASGNILRMIKYFYVSKFGLIQKKELFRKLKQYGDRVGAKSLLNELSTFSYLYYLVADGTTNEIIALGFEKKIDVFRKEYKADAMNRSFDALKLFGVTQNYPLIIKLLESIILSEDKKTREKSATSFLRFINAVEGYHLINNAVSQRPGNEVERYYADKCKESITSSGLPKFINTTISELKNKLVEKDEFIGRCKEISYDRDFYLIYYINDLLNNEGRTGGQIIKIYNPDKKVLKRSYNIDHLVSLDRFKDEDVDESIQHNIGNLLVISMHTNSAVGNKSLEEKLKIFKEKEVQNLPEVRKFVDNWGKRKWATAGDIINNIEERSLELAEKLYNSALNIMK